jgi:hypothetical protein
MMFYRYFNWEAFMRQALTTALMAAAAVFVGGVIFGWQYALFLAFVVLLAISLIEYGRSR